jgi:hypothetical protein
MRDTGRVTADTQCSPLWRREIVTAARMTVLLYGRGVHNATRTRHCCGSRKTSAIMFGFEKQSILSDFSAQTQTLPTLPQILCFHPRIYIFRQHGDTQYTLIERMA